MNDCKHRFYPCVCESRDPSDCTCPDDAACRIQEEYCDHPDTDEQECWRYQEHRAEAAEKDAEKDAERLATALCELTDIVQGILDGGCRPDSFTLQPARAALRAHEALKGATMSKLARGSVVLDVDGVLTRDRVSRYNIGPARAAADWALHQSGLDKRFMRDAVPDVLAREWLRRLRELGFTADLRTARLESRGEITATWLRKNCFEYDSLSCRPRSVDVLAYKMFGVRRSAGCVIYIDDNHQLCREAAKLGDDAPIVIECTDWRVVATILKALTEGMETV